MPNSQGNGDPPQRPASKLSAALHGAAERTEAPGSRDVEARRLHARARQRLFGADADIRIGRFKIEHKLGQGGMGAVYLARADDGQRVAVKAVTSRDKSAHARIRREAKALTRLCHPHVVSVLEVGKHGSDGVYLAMEYIEGQTLRKWLQTPRELDEVVAVFRQAADGLNAVHAEGIVHRDFKPDNLLVDDDGHATLVDFGLVKAVPATAADAISDMNQALTDTGFSMGTVGYMAPEQLLAKPVDGRTDQFALCVALYEALFQRKPFAGKTPEAMALAVLRGKMQPIPEIALGGPLPGHIGQMLGRGLSVRPADRYADMTQLIAKLDGPALTTTRSESGRASGWRWLWALVLRLLRLRR